MICHFYIELEESSPLVWRRIVVPANYNLYQLHMALQGAFGWENSHLFQFCEKDLSDAIGYGIPDDLDSDTEIVDAKKTKVSKIFKKAGQKYHYIYDFGDYWKHQITLEKTDEKEMGAPYCIGGEGGWNIFTLNWSKKPSRYCGGRKVRSARSPMSLALNSLHILPRSLRLKPVSRR